jgi:hypothetical protein
MSKKVIGTKYGIEITKPWNEKMYDHNDLVAKLIKVELFNKLEELYKKGDENELNEFAGAVGTKYGFGFDLKGMYDGITNDLEYLQNYQIEQDLDYYVKKGFVKEPKFGFVGYDK